MIDVERKKGKRWKGRQIGKGKERKKEGGKGERVRADEHQQEPERAFLYFAIFSLFFFSL